MIRLKKVKLEEAEKAISIINSAKEFLKEQGIDQWQNGYPDNKRIELDISTDKAYFVTENEEVLGYLCIDFEGEPAYESLKGEWSNCVDYVVVHRLAFLKEARGKGISAKTFELVEELAKSRGVNYFRVDTDSDNEIMKKVLTNFGFTFCGTIWFDNSEKIAFDKDI